MVGSRTGMPHLREALHWGVWDAERVSAEKGLEVRRPRQAADVRIDILEGFPDHG